MPQPTAWRPTTAGGTPGGRNHKLAGGPPRRRPHPSPAGPTPRALSPTYGNTSKENAR